ncbi:hypothetical protein ACOMHN_036066 [Nucella lapillus]
MPATGGAEQYAGWTHMMGNWANYNASAQPRSSSTYAMRRFRERMKQNSEQYRLYRERQNAWNKKWMAKNRRGKT